MVGVILDYLRARGFFVPYMTTSVSIVLKRTVSPGPTPSLRRTSRGSVIRPPLNIVVIFLMDNSWLRIESVVLS
jgi:hypothetical protein